MSDTFQITLDLPQSLKSYFSPDPGRETKLRILSMLYHEGALSGGKAAEIAGISRYAFETYLSRHKIPLSNLTYEQVMADAASLKKSTDKK